MYSWCGVGGGGNNFCCLPYPKSNEVCYIHERLLFFQKWPHNTSFGQYIKLLCYYYSTFFNPPSPAPPPPHPHLLLINDHSLTPNTPRRAPLPNFLTPPPHTPHLLLINYHFLTPNTPRSAPPPPPPPLPPTATPRSLYSRPYLY